MTNSEREALARINSRQNKQNRFVNITMADVKKEEKRMKKFKFEIREIDAWNYGEEEGWIWNTSYHMGDMVTSAKNEKRAFTSWMKNHAGITFKPNRTLIEYDGDVYTIIDRKTKEPLFAAIPNY